MEGVVAKPTEEGQDPKSATEAIAEVLPSSKFLQNVDLETATSKKSATSDVLAIVQELKAEVQAEKQVSAALRNELESLKLKIEESEAAKQKQQELDSLKKKVEEINSLVRQLLYCLNKE
ncbi:unnamed protein product [Urochloa decumbens]|uniref:Uncharacterized protein n=1 Tax=Urochloa decumbens TaxID=240449 RepID=A0ABC9A0J6_9POAL